VPAVKRERRSVTSAHIENRRRMPQQTKIGWYLTFGHHDWLVIAEFPDEKAAASAILAAAAGGSLSEIETTVAMTAKDAHATFESAGKAAKGFRSAGRS
jgi:uncharacterized protein with GYD domain